MGAFGARVVEAESIGPAPDARAAIVTALSGVAGINAHSTAPDNPVAFDAFPRWARTNYTGGRLQTLGTHEYDVMVILPAGYEPDTVAQGDSLLDAVAAALYPIARVDTADPIKLVFGPAGRGVEMPALRIRVTPYLNPTR